MYSARLTLEELRKDHFKIFYLAIQNQIKQGNIADADRYLDDRRDCENFDWDETPEGEDFWTSVNERDFNTAYEILYTNNMDPTKKKTKLFTIDEETFLEKYKSLV